MLSTKHIKTSPDTTLHNLSSATCFGFVSHLQAEYTGCVNESGDFKKSHEE